MSYQRLLNELAESRRKNEVLAMESLQKIYNVANECVFPLAQRLEQIDEAMYNAKVYEERMRQLDTWAEKIKSWM